MSIAAPLAAPAPRKRRFLAVFGGLTAVNLLTAALAIVTGPLQGRLLGPAGRGELALVLVVCGLAPLIVSCGLGSFLAREMGGSDRRGALLGTVLVLSLALGALGALFAYPVSRYFGDGNEDVQALILLGLLVLPISVAGINLHGAYWGIEAWQLFSLMKLLPALLTAIGFVVLWLAGAFTVVSAALTVYAASLLALIPLAPLVRSTKDWAFDKAVALRGLGFGAKAAVTTAAGQGLVRIDQLFIAALVSTTELGFYVVAGTLAGVTLMASQALNFMVVPMVATGEGHTVRRMLRITLALMALSALLLVMVAEPAIRILFGAEFEDSAALARILGVSSIFIAGKGILSGALVGHGRPGEPAVVEVATVLLLIRR